MALGRFIVDKSGQERVKDNAGGLMSLYRSNWVSYDIIDAKNILKRMDSVFLSIYLIEFILKVGFILHELNFVDNSVL